MTNPCPQFRDDFESAALGLLPPERAEALLAHLRSGCPLCNRALSRSTSVAQALVSAAPHATAVGDVLAAKLARACEPAPASGRSMLWILGPWAALGVACLAIVLLLADRSRLERKIRSLELADTRALAHNMARVIDAPTFDHVKLQSTGVVPGQPTGTAIWHAHRGLLFYSSRLPKLPDGKCYQLWVIRKSEVLSAGIVSMDGEAAILFVPPGQSLEGITGLAVTDEPAGGSVAARGQKLLLGGL